MAKSCGSQYFPKAANGKDGGSAKISYLGLRDQFEDWYPELRAGARDVDYEEPVKMAA